MVATDLVDQRRNRAAQGKLVVRRGRKARGLARTRDGSAASTDRTRHTEVERVSSKRSTWRRANAHAASRPHRPSNVERFRGGLAALAVAALAALTLGVSSPAVHADTTAAEYVVQFTGDLGPAARRALVERAGGRVTREARIIDAVGAELSADEAARLRGQHGVKAVTGNASVEPKTLVNFDPNKMATAYNQSAKSSNLWNSATGKGVGVAVIDTGVAGDLPDFRVSQTDSSSRVVASAVVNPGAQSAGDSYGHGTLVAGILAGNSGYRPANDPLRGKYAGAAPDANIVSVKIADEAGKATVLDAIYGIQFAVDHRADYNIRVINLSVESDEPQSYTTDPLDAAVEAAWNHGIVVVAAAGNRGAVDGAVGYAPGNDPYIITVGAVDDQATKGVTDDVITSWSSRGVTQDGFNKPDLYAPGAHIVANLSPDSAYASLCPSCIVNGSYIQAGGTSLSAPIVAGTVASILQKRPTWTPDMVKGALLNTTRSLPGGGREIDSLNAYNASTDKLTANRGLRASSLISPTSGAIDYSRASWRIGDWSSATDLLAASWTRASWRCNCSTTSTGDIDPTRASWRRASWRTDWSK
jgi:serine protease AprX